MHDPRNERNKGKRWQAGVSWVLLCIFPGAMTGQTSGPAASGAMLAARGNVAVNGRAVANAQALLPGDLTVTQKDAGANLTQSGTNAVVGTETALRYEGEYGVLERGGVSVNTQRGFAVQAGCWTVRPQQWDQWTDYAVSYASAGEVLIQARGGDVRLYGRMERSRETNKAGTSGATMTAAERDRDVNGAPLGSGTMAQDPQPGRGELLRAGQETRREACPVEQQSRRKRGGAATAASTGPLNSTAALYLGAGIAGGVAALFLLKTDNPASPKMP